MSDKVKILDAKIESLENRFRNYGIRLGQVESKYPNLDARLGRLEEQTKINCNKFDEMQKSLDEFEKRL